MIRKKRKMGRLAAVFLCAVLCMGMVSGCSSAGESESEVSTVRESESASESLPVSEPENEPESEPVPAPEETPSEIRNPLTGETGFSEEAVGKRPVTVMINNIGAALPQRGLSAADMIYEAVVEGGITRMMGVYADIDQIPYVGPVRSARHYYVDLSEGLNAIYTHFGGSPTAYNYISRYGVDDVDGKYSNIFYQDSWRAQNRGREHSFFIDGESIKSQAVDNGETLEGDCPSLFDFSTDAVITPSDAAATDVFVPFSGSYNAEFLYDAESGLYLKKRNGEYHIDADSEETIRFENVLILYTTVSALGDGSERRNLDLSSGNGWYVTAGGREEIRWSKGGVENSMTLTDSSGAPLTGNVGKTYICLTDKSYASSVTFE